MTDIESVKQKISQFVSDTNYIKTRTRWNKDLDLFRLKPYNAGKGYFSYTTNAPRNLATKAISMLSEAKLLIKVPEETLDAKERETASNVERFLYGAINMNDEKSLRFPDEPSLKQKMAWYAAVRGGFGVLPYVYKDGDTGDTVLHIGIWDIYNTFWGIGKNGTSWAARLEVVSRDYVEEQYGKTIGAKEAELYDIWTEKENGVLVGSEWMKEPEEHGMNENPVTIFKVGSTPKVYQNNWAYTSTLTGESIFAANRDLYPIYNKTISDLLTLVRRGVKVPIGVWSKGGQENIDEDIWQTEKAASVPFDSNKIEKIEELIKPSMPADAKDLVNLASGDLQRGGISHVAEGELGFRLSGFAINQLQAQLSTVIVPFASTIQQAVSYICDSLHTQYTAKSWKPVNVRGRASNNKLFGVPKAIKIKPSDVKGEWKMDIQLLPIMPKDDAQRYELARLAKEGQFMSTRTIQDTLLELEDTNLENEKMSQEWADELPTVKLYKALLGALADGRNDIAMMIVTELQRLMQAQGGQAGGKGGGIGSMRRGADMAGVGLPPNGMGGLSPETLPSETQGGLPGGAANAQMSMFGAEV